MTKDGFDNIMYCDVKAIPKAFSCWDKTHIKGDLSIAGIFEYYKKNLSVVLDSINYGKVSLFNLYMTSDKEGEMAKTPC